MKPGSAVSGAEAAAASLVSAFAAPVVIGYLLDRLGLTFAPLTMLFVACASIAAPWLLLRRHVSWLAGELIAFLTVVTAAFAWLLWLARPAFLPLGGGPDLTHHLLLIQYIERHWRLVHDASVEAYLGEMVHYTPGSQILAALAGAWMRSDGFHAVHAVVAASVAVKAGLVFLIALRLMPAAAPRIPLALTSLALLLLPLRYLLGSFTNDSFFAQVVSELFAVAMWWAVTMWDAHPSTGSVALFALAGMAAFLTWPVWTAAPLLTLLIVIAARERLSSWERFRYLAIASAPILGIAALYIVGRLGWLGIARTGGKVLHPFPSEYGWWFLALSACGMVAAATLRRGRTTAIFTASIGIQALAHYVLTLGTETPYLALKMFYLAIYPQAVAAALALAIAWQIAARLAPERIQSTVFHGRGSQWLAWAFATVVAVRSALPIAAMRTDPVVSEPLYRAGSWARDNVAPGCVDYLVGRDYTAYWLHLAVLGNPRMSERTGTNDTYEPVAEIVRWLTPDGLPYAVAELPALPRDVRTDLDIVADFGAAAVVKRHGPASCPGALRAR